MKHIFSIHSPITYFCAANVVLHEELQKDEVIFLYTSFVPPSDLGVPIPSFYTKNKTVLKKIKTFHLVKSYDKYLNEIADGEQFRAYIDLAHYYQKILITHNNCIGFHFIEEGTASYIAPRKLEELTRIELSTSFRFEGFKEKLRAILRILRGFNLKLLALPYFANAFTFSEGSKYYGFSPAIYPGVSVERKVILKARSIRLSEETKEFKLSNTLLLIEESYFRVYNIEKKDLEYCMEQTMSILKNEIGSRPIYVKIRPGQQVHDSIWIAYLNKHQISHQVLPEQMVLEEFLVESENCKVIGTVSSLLYYASIFGHETFSNYALIPKKPTSVFDELGFYWERVSTLTKYQCENSIK